MGSKTGRALRALRQTHIGGITVNATNQLELENILDSTTLQDVLKTLADICYGKAEHLQVNWQDEEAARQWTLAALRVDNCSSKVSV
jgi:hypothetical protein